MSLIRNFLGGIWGYAAAAAAAIAAILIALAKAKKAGEDQVIAKAATKEVENANKANQIERDVATIKPDAVRDELRKYTRD